MMQNSICAVLLLKTIVETQQGKKKDSRRDGNSSAHCSEVWNACMQQVVNSVCVSFELEKKQRTKLFQICNDQSLPHHPRNIILAEGARALSVTLSGGALFASWKLLQFPSSLIVKVILAIFRRASAQRLDSFNIATCPFICSVIITKACRHIGLSTVLTQDHFYSDWCIYKLQRSPTSIPAMMFVGQIQQ